MPRNGTGAFALPEPDVVTGASISSTDYNSTMADLATAMTGSLARDGQGGMTGNLPMGGNRITGLANGTVATDAATRAQVLAPPGDVTIAKASPQLVMDKTASGQTTRITGSLNAVPRWLIDIGDETAEAGANAGSNFRIGRYDDAGAFVDFPIRINRSTGGPVFADPAVWRAGLSAPAAPTLTSGPGFIQALSVPQNTPMALPAGGMWFWSYTIANSGLISLADSGVSVGGASIGGTGPNQTATGFIWRIA